MKKLVSLFSLCILTLALVIPTFASDIRPGDVSGTDSSVTGQSDSSSTTGGPIQDAVNSATNELIDTGITTEDIVGRLEEKGNDVVSVLQTVGKYVCFGAFILCCGLIVIGIIGNKRMLTGAILGAILSGIAYAGIVCGREIVNWIASWAIS